MDGSFQAVRTPAGATPSGRAVVAYAVGLDVAELAPFVRSLRAVFSGQIILAVDRKPTLIAWLRTHDVEGVILPRARFWSPPGLARWGFFSQILTSRPEIRYVLAVDPAGVVFQADPLADTPTRLQFVEDSGRSVRPALMRDLIGEALAAKIGAQAPILTDVIAGPSADVVRFCGSMQRLSAASRTVPGGPMALEQGVCTVIARLGLDGGQIMPNFGRVSIAGEQHRIVDGRVSHPQRGVSAVLLGYRQHPLLARHVAQNWGVGPMKAARSVTGWRRALEALQGGFGLAPAGAGATPQGVLAPTAARSRRSSDRMVAASGVSSARLERAASESA